MLVVVENEAVQIRLQVLLRNDLVRAFDRALYVRPECLDVVHMHVTAHVFMLTVFDGVSIITDRYVVQTVSLIREQASVRHLDVSG